jgi:murein DD-endopeptidase / murein LD-carboxypeptidase
MTTIKTKKTILYLAAVLIVAQGAANIRRSPHLHDLPFTDPYSDNPQLREKIEAFKKGGVEKKVDHSDYDVEGVIEYAKSLLGTPHVMGGYSTSGLDCSGMVKLAHAQFGVTLPHASDEQGRYGTIIYPDEELRRGDLVFFHSTYAKRSLITHSGIYLGENKFIHTSTSRGVTISKLFDAGYWQKHYLFATRLAD